MQKFSVAGGSAPTPTCLRRLGASSPAPDTALLLPLSDHPYFPAFSSFWAGSPAYYVNRKNFALISFERKTTFAVISPGFPDGCTSYQGPHNITCVQSSFVESGCSPEGRSYPTTESISDYNYLNLKWVSRKFYLVTTI